MGENEHVAGGAPGLSEGKTLRIGLIQARARVPKAQAVAHALDAIGQAASQGAALVCMQELFATPYFCQVEDAEQFDLAEPLDGPTATAIRGAARHHRVTVVTSLFERRAPGLYHNTALVIGPAGEDLGLYRKMHIPHDPHFGEKYYFTPGDTGFVAVPTPGATVGPLVCWDQWYPEAARLTAMKGAELLIYPTAIGWLPSEKDELGAAQLSAWQTIQRSHAIANGVFVVAVNRVGFEPGRGSGIEFWGHSMVVDPSGTLLYEAGLDEEIQVVDCDLRALERQRRDWPFLRDRRIDAYAGLTRRFDDGG